MDLRDFRPHDGVKIDASLHVTLHLSELFGIDACKVAISITVKKIADICMILPKVADLWEQSFPCLHPEKLALIEDLRVNLADQSCKLVSCTVRCFNKLPDKDVLFKKLHLPADLDFLGH